MPDMHAKLSPSSAKRWINCPGSVALSEQCPPQKTSEYAEEGTRAHAVAEAKLRLALGEIDKRKAGRLIKKQEPDGEMGEHTDYYRDAVTEIYYSAGEDAELMVEQKLDLSAWAFESFGTADAVVVGGGKIEVIDLKYGTGVAVSAEGNPQLRLYGLGAADLFEGLYSFDVVRMTIIQPRQDRVSTEELPLEELRAWGRDVVRPAAELALQGAEVYSCGDWCRWCPAAAQCRTRADKMIEGYREDFKEPALLTDEELGDYFSKLAELKAYCTHVGDFMKEQALNGRKFAGWKLVEGRSARKVVNEAGLVEAMKAAGYDEALLYERKLYGITALEKITGKKEFKKITDGKGIVEKPPGSPTLVPESDSRMELNTAGKAAEDFKED